MRWRTEGINYGHAGDLAYIGGLRELIRYRAEVLRRGLINDIEIRLMETDESIGNTVIILRSE